MGNELFDDWTWTHFAWGLLFGYVKMPAHNFFMSHTSFEILENSTYGRKYLFSGTKDSTTNIVGDTMAAMGGWYVGGKLTGAAPVDLRGSLGKDFP
jgi:hypothetical protein